MRHTEAALRWVVDILHKEHIPFEIDGGLAAEMYGAKRELADIDINVGEGFDRILPHVREYIHYGPTHYEDDQWRVYLMTIKFAGQNIDISPLDQMSYYDPQEKVWVPFSTDLSNVRVMRYLDMDLPFIAEEKLIAYKEIMGRGVDRKDVRGMEATFNI